MKEKEILIKGIKASFKIWEGEKPLLILHGWGAGSDSWIKVAEGFSRKGYKAICPDLPGFGKSQPPPNPWSVNDYLFWLIEFLNYLKINKFYLAAHSFGGRIAVKLAAGYPQNLEKLILVSPAGIKMKFGLKTLAIRLIAEIGKFIFKSRFLKVFKDAARGIFYVFLRKSDYVKAKGAMKETMKKVIEEDLSSELSKIKTRTLIVWGEKDKMVLLKYGRIFNKEIKNSKLEIISKVGHSPQLETPEKLINIILKFIN